MNKWSSPSGKSNCPREHEPTAANKTLSTTPPGLNKEEAPNSRGILHRASQVADAEHHSHSNTSKSVRKKAAVQQLQQNRALWQSIQISETLVEQLTTAPKYQQTPLRRLRKIRGKASTSSHTAEHDVALEQAQDSLDL